ncbi:hypothetical protein AURDEDRAFT_146826 [Auricularia subglabra TFB-10046 SS5]|nr:hypothetical protein AURDEDRAFT_146826 [Auricularia subglabra TFB-10046 SS5]
MVHRPGDTQLLAQLIKHEKDYAAAFQALAVASASSRDSLSAYAAASPAHIARPIAVLVGALAAADDALTGYRESFEEWREHLHRLKELEDELAVVLRDRQILINRVIKVSKSPRPAAGSSSQTSSGSLDAKVAQAQAELRACEAYLVDKEREHEAAWARAMRDGLRARCKALVDYGWHCAEKGKDALHALDEAASGPHTLPPPAPPHNFFKPLPDPRMNGSALIMPAPGPGSDNSSLTPSQSASQTDHGAPVSRSSSLSRPPEGLPTNAYPQPHPIIITPALNRPIVEEPEQTGSSSEEEHASGTLCVVENHPRQSVLSLQSGSRHAPPVPPAAQSHTSLHKKSRRASQQQHPHQTPNGVVPFPYPGPAPTIPRAPSWSSAGSGEKARKRATSFSFLGSISSMFGGHKREPSSPSKSQGTGAWATRTDARLRRRTNDSSDDERANWASDGGGTLTRSISRGSVRSRKNSEEPSKTYIRANKAAAGGFAFSRSPSVTKNGKNALSGSPRSSSDVGPSSSVRRASADRAAVATASMRRNVLEANHGPSLMSIVEGAQSPSRNSTLRRDGSVSKRRESVQVVASSSSPRQQQEPDRAYEPPPVRHEPVTREAEARMGPLRSALRNGGNRSPSPASVDSPVRSYAAPSAPAPVPSSPLARPSTLPPSNGDVTDTDSDADSFETGHETLLGDSDVPADPQPSFAAPVAPVSHQLPQAPRPASPPLRMPSPTPAIHAPSPLPAVPPKPFAHDLGSGPGSSSSSTLSNSGATVTMGTVSSAGTVRRKSVRMVLPPDFAGTPLPTPTAEPAASSWHSRTSVRDVWDDSSEDDGEYQRARAALAQADRKLSKAGEPEEPQRPTTRTSRY